MRYYAKVSTGGFSDAAIVPSLADDTQAKKETRTE